MSLFTLFLHWVNDVLLPDHNFAHILAFYTQYSEVKAMQPGL